MGRIWQRHRTQREYDRAQLEAGEWVEPTLRILRNKPCRISAHQPASQTMDVRSDSVSV